VPIGTEWYAISVSYESPADSEEMTVTYGRKVLGKARLWIKQNFCELSQIIFQSLFFCFP
jgi:hypothetical protein